MVDRLEEIATQGAVGGKDPTQAIGDIRSTGLASGSAADAAITPFGVEVRERWDRLGVATGDSENEIARCGVLVRVGVEQGVELYVNMYDAWRRRVALQPAEYWLQDRWHLFASSYLDKTSESGYNGFEVITVLNDGRIGSEGEWRQLAEIDHDIRPNIDILIARVTGQRLNQRANFCKAMELFRLTATTTKDAVPDQIVAWRNV